MSYPRWLFAHPDHYRSRYFRILSSIAVNAKQFVCCFGTVYIIRELAQLCFLLLLFYQIFVTAFEINDTKSNEAVCCLLHKIVQLAYLKRSQYPPPKTTDFCCYRVGDAWKYHTTLLVENPRKPSPIWISIFQIRQFVCPRRTIG